VTNVRLSHTEFGFFSDDLTVGRVEWEIDIRFTPTGGSGRLRAGSWWHFCSPSIPPLRSDTVFVWNGAAYVHVFPKQTSGLCSPNSTDPLLPTSRGWCGANQLLRRISAWLVSFALRISSRPLHNPGEGGCFILFGNSYPATQRSHQSQLFARSNSKEATLRPRDNVWFGMVRFPTRFLQHDFHMVGRRRLRTRSRGLNVFINMKHGVFGVCGLVHCRNTPGKI